MSRQHDMKDGKGAILVRTFSDSYLNWAILSGSQGHWELQECVSALHRMISRPVQLFWPAPYGQPVLIKSDGFDPADGHHCLYRIDSTMFPGIAPQLWVHSPGLPAELQEAVLAALAERWRKVGWESAQALDQVWNTLWLAVHGGKRNLPVLYDLLTQGAETIVRAPVILLAVRRAGYQVLEMAHARGVKSESWRDHPIPIGQGLGGFVAEFQEGVRVADYDTSPWYHSRESVILHHENLRGGMAVPWQAMDGVDGVLYAWFHNPGAPSPLALYAFERYVRSIPAVVMSAQGAGMYSNSAILAQFAEDPALQGLLRILRLARRQNSWKTLLSELSQWDIKIQVCDTWGQILRQSPDLPGESPVREVALDGIETTTLSVWGELRLVDKLYPHLIQTLRVLIDNEARLHDMRLKQLAEWVVHLNRLGGDEEEIWQRREDFGLTQPITQIWGIRLAHAQSLMLSGRSVIRAIRRKFNVQPILEERTIWAWVSVPVSVDEVDGFRKELTRDLAQPVFVAGMTANAEVSIVVGAMQRIKEVLSQEEQQVPRGLTRFLGRPQIDQLFCLPENHAALKLFVEAWIGPILRYDQDNNTDLVKTLGTYLATPHVNQAARNLYIHPNTMRYRLEQITRLVSLDWQDPAVRTALLIATEAWRCIRDKSNWNMLSGSESSSDQAL